jgi:hypothetical protein
MGELVSRYSGRVSPNLPFLNGFCLLIRREVIDSIGYFDEENFGDGYGEENDYCLRARQAGWKLAVADDTYIFHAQSRSYSDEKRKMLSERAGARLAQKHGQSVIDGGVALCIGDRILRGIRERSRIMIDRQGFVQLGQERFAGKRVLFVLPISVSGGGGNVVISEARAMREMGVEAAILNLKGHQHGFERAYPNLDVPVHYAEVDEFAKAIVGFDSVIATFNPSVDWIAPAITRPGCPVFGYYVQDFEPFFYRPGSEEHRRAVESYTLVPNTICFSKTDWTSDQLKNNLNVDCGVVGCSIDLDLFRPRLRRDRDWPDRPLRIAAMIRPGSSYRQPLETMESLMQASRQFGSSLEIILFGTDPADPGFLGLPRDFPYSLAGLLGPEQVAFLLNEVDIFADFSSYQAMGLTALEAMACGAAVIVPKLGGATTFANDGSNSLVIDTSSPQARREALSLLIRDHSLRSQLQENAIRDSCRYFAEKPAYNILNTLFLGRESGA